MAEQWDSKPTRAFWEDHIWGPKCPQRTAEVAVWLPKRASGDSAVTEREGRLQPRTSPRVHWVRGTRSVPERSGPGSQSGRGPQESEQ